MAGPAPGTAVAGPISATPAAPRAVVAGPIATAAPDAGGVAGPISATPTAPRAAPAARAVVAGPTSATPAAPRAVAAGPIAVAAVAPQRIQDLHRHWAEMRGFPLWPLFQADMEAMGSDHRAPAPPAEWSIPFQKVGRTPTPERKRPWRSRSEV